MPLKFTKRNKTFLKFLSIDINNTKLWNKRDFFSEEFSFSKILLIFFIFCEVLFSGIQKTPLSIYFKSTNGIGYDKLKIINKRYRRIQRNILFCVNYNTKQASFTATKICDLLYRQFTRLHLLKVTIKNYLESLVNLNYLDKSNKNHLQIKIFIFLFRTESHNHLDYLDNSIIVQIIIIDICIY